MSLTTISREPRGSQENSSATCYFLSETAERRALGAILKKPALLDTTFALLTVDDFGDDRRRRCFRAACELRDEGEPVDPQTIASRAATNGDVARLEAWLTDLRDGAVAAGITQKTVAELKQVTKKRKVAALTDKAAKRSRAGDDPDEIAAELDSGISELRYDPTEETAPSQRPDMPELCLDGRLGEIYQRRLKTFPLAYAWITLLVVAGVMLERLGAGLRTNLFGATVGPTDSGKTASMEHTCRVLGMFDDPRLLRDAKFGSGEGLAEALADVEPNAVRLLAPDELAHLTAKMAIDRSSLAAILNTAYYRDVQQGGSRGRPFTIDTRLSVMGGLVEDQFGDNFGAATIGGFYDRFIFGLCPQPSQYLYRPFEGRAEVMNPFHMPINADVWDARDHWVRSEGIKPRVATHALRVAYICGAFDGRSELRAADLGPALEFARYQMRARTMLAPNPGENPDAKCAVSILSWLQQHAANGEWVSRRTLHKGIHAERVGPLVFNRTLKQLAFNSEIALNAGEKKIRLVKAC